MIREVESASLCNNSAPDDSSCLKIRLEDAKVHQVILFKSKICMLSQKRVLNPKSKLIIYRSISINLYLYLPVSIKLYA